MKTRFTCRRRRCLPPSSPFVQKGRKPSPGPNSPIGTWPGPSPTNADNSLHAYKVPRSDHYRRGGVTVPRATRCNRRVAPGWLSPAAPSGRGHWKGWPPVAGAEVSGVRAASRWTRRNPHPRAIINTFTVPAPAATDARGAVLTRPCPAYAPPAPLQHAGATRRRHPPPPSTRKADPPLPPKKAPRTSHHTLSPPPSLPLPPCLRVAAGRWRRGGCVGASGAVPPPLPYKAPVDVFGQERAVS